MNRRIFILKILNGFFTVTLLPVLKYVGSDSTFSEGGKSLLASVRTPVPCKRNHISELKSNSSYILRTSSGNAEVNLNEMGRLIWSKIDGRNSCYQIAESITNRYDVNFAEAASDVEQFVKKLGRHGFVTIDRSCPCYAYQIADRHC
jgi:hypothetical protein